MNKNMMIGISLVLIAGTMIALTVGIERLIPQNEFDQIDFKTNDLNAELSIPRITRSGVEIDLTNLYYYTDQNGIVEATNTQTFVFDRGREIECWEQDFNQNQCEVYIGQDLSSQVESYLINEKIESDRMKTNDFWSTLSLRNINTQLE